MEERPIRILQVTGKMEVGGAETLIMNLYRHMDRSRVQLDFVENTTDPSFFDEEIRSMGGRIYKCPHYTGKNHWTYIRWWKRFWKEHAGEYGVIHGHIGSTAAIYLRLAKKQGLYTIAHSHGENGTGFGDFLYRLYAFPTRFIADQFFACSRLAGIDRFGKRVGEDPNRCRLLKNAIDTEKYAYREAQRQAMRARYGLGEKDLLIGHVGRFAYEKNHSFLIDIFAVLCRAREDARLILVGAEDAGRKIRGKAEALGLSDKVIFTGVQQDTVPFYQAMDLFLLPSLSEGLPLVMVEAQASGLPCVISDRVSEDCILTEDLVTVCSLQASPEEWARHILSRIPTPRQDRSAELAAKGFDITQTAKWLERFYVSKGKNHEE